jgi:hypothetical protein
MVYLIRTPLREELQDLMAQIARLRESQAELSASAQEEAHRRVRQEAASEETVGELEVAKNASDRYTYANTY